MENTDTAFCGHCKDEVQENQQGMCCEICEVWFHLSCVNISTALYDLLMLKEDDEDDGFRWYCPACRNKCADNTNDNVKATVQKEIKSALPDIVKTVLTETKECAEVLSKTYATIVKKQQQNMIQETVKETSNMALKESMISLESNLAEKKRRTRNVIISGVPEQEQEDIKDVVFGILKPLEGRLEKNEILTTSRLGQKKDDSDVSASTTNRRSLG